MTVSEIIDSLTRLTSNLKPQEFVYEFLDCFGTPKATIARLRSGALNVAKKPGSTLLKSKVYFEPLNAGSSTAMSPSGAVEAAKLDRQVCGNKPRFLIATDFTTLAAFDTKREDAVEFPIADLHDHYGFFLPLAGMERTVFHAEVEADVRAAEQMAKLYDLIRADNPTRTPEERHALNVFLTRLLFCYFAEDTGIFPEQLFTKTIDAYTQADGSDLAESLSELFVVLNTEPKARRKIKPHLADFPYVNGGLFDETPARRSLVPSFSAKARQKLIELGKKSWKEINPDIFGSMFQGVVDDEKRAELGMHYTSVPNIMKVIKPLFLDELYEELAKVKDSESKLKKLLARIARMRFFDPACGSGNFLIIAYKELRRLEMAIFRELLRLSEQLPLSLTGIHVSQFYGIELDDFACAVAMVALWLAEHQMNVECQEAFGKAPVSLPLRDGARIVWGNATQLDWDDVCPKEDGREVFVMGNPPYYGARNQAPEQKRDVERCFRGAPEHKDADYICCWFVKGGVYVADGGAELAFVTTNSVCQGDHIGILWPRLLEKGLEVSFAHRAFKWTNNAKAKAGVTCVIVGLRRASTKARWIFSGGIKTRSENINPYLANAANIIIGRRPEPMSSRPTAVMGSMARDGGFLILSKEQRQELLDSFPQAEKLLRPLYGTQEFIDGLRRWCLWISTEDLPFAKSIAPIAERIANVFEFRTASKAKTTNGYAGIAHQFAQRAHNDGPVLMIPRVTSERRTYVPIGWFSNGPIISDLGIAIYGAEMWLFSVMSSKMHMVWAKAVAGGLETRVRYSTSIVYNNFPLPDIDASKNVLLSQLAEDVLIEREKHPGKSIADLYDPDTMPTTLLAAHRALDEAVESCYRAKPFASDEERLEYLFRLYEAGTAAERGNPPSHKKAVATKSGASI